jgi:hypothetical protein
MILALVPAPTSDWGCGGPALSLKIASCPSRKVPSVE